MIISNRNMHRRLAELLARQFFPHRVNSGPAHPDFRDWRDNQTWRGRVIVTREAFPDSKQFSAFILLVTLTTDSCAFNFQTRPIPQPAEFAYRRNADLLLQLSSYSRFFKVHLAPPSFHPPDPTAERYASQVRQERQEAFSHRRM